MVCTQDRPGLFASITGVLSALSLDILNARIFTASDGRILDVFRISHHGRAGAGHGGTEVESQIRALLDQVLDGKIDVVKPGRIIQADILSAKATRRRFPL